MSAYYTDFALKSSSERLEKAQMELLAAQAAHELNLSLEINRLGQESMNTRVMLSELKIHAQNFVETLHRFGV